MPVFKTSGVCAPRILFEISPDGTVTEVCFEGGCNGNSQGVARLVEGRPAAEVVALLSGIRCDSKATSCPDQLARALLGYLEQTATVSQVVPTCG